MKKPSNAKLIGSRWVFTMKSGPEIKYKARLVAKGFMQRESVDYEEVYSPVARLSTIRVLLSIGVQKMFTFYQMDVKTAFLHGYIKEDVYLSAPDGVNVPDGSVLKLNRSLYGLKQSPKCWNTRFNDFITGIGYTQSSADYCLYYKTEGGKIVYLVLYVDDMLICGDNNKEIDTLKKALSSEFRRKDLGEVKTFMGINITHDKINNILTFDQKEYILNILEKFEMDGCSPIDIP